MSSEIQVTCGMVLRRLYSWWVAGRGLALPVRQVAEDWVCALETLVHAVGHLGFQS